MYLTLPPQYIEPCAMSIAGPWATRHFSQRTQRHGLGRRLAGEGAGSAANGPPRPGNSHKPRHAAAIALVLLAEDGPQVLLLSQHHHVRHGGKEKHPPRRILRRPAQSDPRDYDETGDELRIPAQTLGPGRVKDVHFLAKGTPETQPAPRQKQRRHPNDDQHGGPVLEHGMDACIEDPERLP